MIDYKQLKQQAIDRNPLVEYIRKQGRDLVKKGTEWACICYFHDDSKPSMQVNEQKNKYHCFACNAGGNVIDLHMHLKSIDFKAAVEELSGADTRDLKPANDTKLQGKRTIEYEYKDAYGNVVFIVMRIEGGGKKTFRQCHIANGERVFNMDGVGRVLYRMDKIHDKEQVFVCEGEKCVHALVRLGFDATTNCGGSSNWMDAYADMLQDKDVVIMPDNDEAGEKWYKSVLDSIQLKAKSIQTLRMPSHYNDIGDAYEDIGEEACDLIFDLQEKNPPVMRGADVPILSSGELMDIYTKDITAEHRISMDLGRWLPGLRQNGLRPLVPGDMFLVMAATGVGKSAALQNIAVSVPDLTVLFFEIELPEVLMAERWTAIQEGVHAEAVERRVKAGGSFDHSKWAHVYTCTLAGIDVARIEQIIKQAELKIGHKPHVVMIDYIGLIAGGGTSRYERLSTNVEELKSVAKRCGVIMGLASQLKRKEEGEIEVYLSDAKESGSIENSCGLILGCWRPSADEMKVKVLKGTRGGAGILIDCKHHGGSLVIKEVM